MGDESLLAVDHHAHAAADLARQQRGDQLDIERLGAATEAAADMRLDHADARHVHVEDLRQHQMHVVGHLRAGMDGHAVAHGVVFGDRRVHLHLVLADLGAIVGPLAHEIGLAQSPASTLPSSNRTSRSILPGLRSCRRPRRAPALLGRVVGRQLAHLQLDQPQALTSPSHHRSRRPPRPARRDSAPCRAPTGARCARSAARRRSCRSRRR